MSTKKLEKNEKLFWAVMEDYSVKQVLGWPSGMRDYWWIQELSYAIRYGKGIFDTEVDAVRYGYNVLKDVQQKNLDASLKLFNQMSRI